MIKSLNLKSTFVILLSSAFFVACQGGKKAEDGSDVKNENSEETESVVIPMDTLNAISDPLVTHIYTADPSAHVFEGKLYIYPSHDYDAGIPEKDDGSHFAMRDYHVFSLETVGGEVTDHGKVLDLDDVPWAGRQLWAPDAAHKDGTYYLYFPAKDKEDIFRIGVATSDSPAGPFKAEENYIPGTYSMDPAVYEDTDGTYYMYIGGIWGGQLQRWRTGEYDPEGEEPADDEPAINPVMAKMSDDMLTLAEDLRDVLILDENGDPILAGDHDRRFFEAPWIHKYNGKYYLSYSTGNTHYIAYAIGDNPYGPFTYQGIILNPVVGWTNHHSIAEFEGQWYLFYHDSSLSGQTPLRSMKMTELTHRPDGTIETIDPYLD